MTQSPRVSIDGLSDWLTRLLGTKIDSVTITPLLGDASTRRYFRVHLQSNDDGVPDSVMLMELESPEEGDDNDFTTTLKFLQELDFPVPVLFGYDPVQGIAILEDLGDDTLEAYLNTCTDDERDRLYNQAVELIADLQHLATAKLNETIPAYHLKFDVEKLMWEMDFMLEHYVRGMLGQSPESITPVRESLNALCEELAQLPSGFTHRDYHSRNLMVRNGKLMMIDFQDARIGPWQYDLVSLLRDSYMPLPEASMNRLIEHFITRKQTLEGITVDRDQFMHGFHLMALQRNLKAIGTFAYQTQVLKRPRYQESIPPTLQYIKHTLGELSKYPALVKTLKQSFPDLRD